MTLHLQSIDIHTRSNKTNSFAALIRYTTSIFPVARATTFELEKLTVKWLYIDMVLKF